MLAQARRVQIAMRAQICNLHGAQHQMRSMRISSQIVRARSVQGYAERGNEDKIKNFNKNEENRRFSTLISLDLHKKGQKHCFDNASVVFYLVLPKCDSPLLRIKFCTLQ